jgi:hypothetical protein
LSFPFKLSLPCHLLLKASSKKNVQIKDKKSENKILRQPFFLFFLTTGEWKENLATKAFVKVNTNLTSSGIPFFSLSLSFSLCLSLSLSLSLYLSVPLFLCLCLSLSLYLYLYLSLSLFNITFQLEVPLRWLAVILRTETTSRWKMDLRDLQNKQVLEP